MLWIHLLLQWSFTSLWTEVMDVSVICNWKCCWLLNCVSFSFNVHEYCGELYGFLNGCGVEMFAMALIICEHRTITIFASNCISWVMMISIYINFFLWFDKFHFSVTLWLFARGIYLHVWITRNFPLSNVSLQNVVSTDEHHEMKKKTSWIVE